MHKALFFSFVFSAAMAGAAERSVECGDHWYSVEARWTEGQETGKVYFGGDSNPTRESAEAKITRNNNLIQVVFNDQAGGGLRVEGTTGYLKENRDGEESEISPCYVK